jgi:TctA family transporter
MLPKLDIASTSLHDKIAAAVEHGFSVRIANLLSPELVAKLMPALAGAGVAIPATALYMAHRNKKRTDQAKNHAFGAGMAAGVAAPRIIRSLNAALNPDAGVM